MCISLGAGSREWSISLPDCEEVLALGASDKLVAVATDARFLRIFSIMGTQREVVCIPGPVLAVTAQGDQICVVYHSGTTSANGDSILSAMIVQAVGLSLRVTNIQIPLTPGSKLAWIGYSDQGSPISADSIGMIRLYSAKSCYWMPICDMTLQVSKLCSNL